MSGFANPLRIYSSIKDQAVLGKRGHTGQLASLSAAVVNRERGSQHTLPYKTDDGFQSGPHATSNESPGGESAPGSSSVFTLMFPTEGNYISLSHHDANTMQHVCPKVAKLIYMNKNDSRRGQGLRERVTSVLIKTKQVIKVT